MVDWPSMKKLLNSHYSTGTVINFYSYVNVQHIKRKQYCIMTMSHDDKTNSATQESL